ncbi:DUF4124 domain-containing protein [Colwellia sp. MB02u-10]|uniref:DUF4124 domain-containing protein n=1 Tax=Colwellia sp. MB02u-10 TaxID=2759828 RepID=UPI0015F6701D|nr:DUF4124 domain-containing protein [Colwellia sp. MB02u-10]MBA6341939.1 DUF4124 domain-containing protein [Colwellia sp. MB02u-10]
MHIKTLSFCLVTLVSFDVFAAEKMTVYRWFDEHNVVHFSQHQPDRDDYIEISMSNNKKYSVIIDEASSDESLELQNNTLGDSSEESNVNNELNDERCLTARENITTLANFDNVQFKGGQGSVEILTTLEKQQQLTMNRKQAEVYCTD